MSTLDDLEIARRYHAPGARFATIEGEWASFTISIGPVGVRYGACFAIPLHGYDLAYAADDCAKAWPSTPSRVGAITRSHT